MEDAKLSTHSEASVPSKQASNFFPTFSAAPAASKAAAKGGKAGKLLSKAVTGASALLQGTAMLTLAGETREMEGGLTLRSGSVEVNCAFETELRVLRDDMASEIAAILFA